MIKEKVIISAIEIDTPGQVMHFQIKVPRDAERIIGIEYSISQMQQLGQIGGNGGGNGTLGGAGGTGGTGGTGDLGGGGAGGSPNIFNLIIQPNSPMGDFRLQGCDNANIFYAADVYTDDTNVSQGDFSATEKEYTHEYKQYEDVLSEEGCITLIKGIYRDKQDPNAVVIYAYILKIYVWYEHAERDRITKKL